MMDRAEFDRVLDALMPDVIRDRRHLHRHPELSGEEKQTSAWLADRCRELDLEVRERIGGYGILARLHVGRTLPWLALRADMDALPVEDQSGTDYASQFPQRAHACGHDAHSAMLLGAARLLSRFRHALPCNVAFIFQPAEETCSGAAAMLADHVFSDLRPQHIFAFHVYPQLPAGSLGIREGIMCAAADLFEVHVEGRGGHAARPHEATDVILIASHMIQALHHIIGRRVDPLAPAVLTIGQIRGGFAANVIPDHVRFSGTVRTLHPDAHETIRGQMIRIIRQTAEAWGATASFTLHQACPVLCNDTESAQASRAIFASWLPEAPLIELEQPSMGGEDFSEFLRHIPGCLFRLGTGSTPATRYPLHHPCFNIDERAMKHGVGAMAALALGYERLQQTL